MSRATGVVLGYRRCLGLQAFVWGYSNYSLEYSFGYCYDHGCGFG